MSNTVTFTNDNTYHNTDISKKERKLHTQTRNEREAAISDYTK